MKCFLKNTKPYWKHILMLSTILNFLEIFYIKWEQEDLLKSSLVKTKLQSTCYQYKQSFVGNKAKGRISKLVFQENKAHQIFQKTNISYPLIRTRTCAYQGERKVRFSENLVCFVFLLPLLRFDLFLPYYRRYKTLSNIYEGACLLLFSLKKRSMVRFDRVLNTPLHSA